MKVKFFLLVTFIVINGVDKFVNMHLSQQSAACRVIVQLSQHLSKSVPTNVDYYKILKCRMYCRTAALGDEVAALA